MITSAQQAEQLKALTYARALCAGRLDVEAPTNAAIIKGYVESLDALLAALRAQGETPTVEEATNRLYDHLRCAGEPPDPEFSADVAKLIAAVRSAPPLAESVEGWQPIETAPKDGTEILIWGIGLCCSSAVCWLSHDIDWWHVEDGKHGPWPIRGASPTHWMPLPAPPRSPAAP